MSARPGIALLSGDAHPALAQAVAAQAGVELVPAAIGAFADGETRVRIQAELRDADVYVLQPTSHPTNERLMVLALLADAARAAGAARVTALLPYFGYARQDLRRQPGEPRSAQLAARLLHAAGVDRAVALELHAPALESAFPMPLAQLTADEALLPAVRALGLRDAVVVSPDAGGLKRAQRYATALETPLAVVAKARPRPDVATALEVLGAVRGRSALLVDDLASTGGTVAAAAAALHAAGARELSALFVHAVLAPGALERIAAAGVGRIVTTDSVPGPPDARLQVVSVAPLFARALLELCGGSRHASDHLQEP